MRNKIIKALELNFEKERFAFLSKYYSKNNEYTQEDLYIVDDIKEMLSKMEKDIKEADDIYHFLTYVMDEDEYISNYEHDEGLYVYNKYKRFTSESRSMMALREEELSSGNHDINSFLFWVVRDIVNEFKYIETNIYNILEIDINYMIDDLNNYYTRYRSAIFFGDNCNKKVNEVVEKIEGQSIYEVEMKEDKDKENLQLLKDLINEDWHYYAQNDIVIIKNADVAFYDDLDTRTALLTFFSEIYEKGHVTLLLTSEDPNYLDDVKALAGVRFAVGDDCCFKISQ